jgi:hypothetical protein
MLAAAIASHEPARCSGKRSCSMLSQLKSISDEDLGLSEQRLRVQLSILARLVPADARNAQKLLLLEQQGLNSYVEDSPYPLAVQPGQGLLERCLEGLEAARQNNDAAPRCA